MKHVSRRGIVLGAVVALVVGLLAGCGGSSSSSSSSSSAAPTSASTSSSASSSAAPAAPSSASLGTPHKATKSPYLFGMINDNSGPVTFPEVSQAATAGIDYVNNYLNGINGHPIQLDLCSSDGQPATSQSCANQIAAKHPMLILGGADTGSSGAFPVWERDSYAYVGGPPFTPVESNAPNAVIFISLVVSDNGAAIQYAKAKLGIKTASILATDNTQGLYTGSVIANEMKGAGIVAKTIPVSPTAADLSAPAASAIGNSPDLVYDETPNACPAALKALKSVGYSGKIAGIDPCTSPPAIASAGSAAEGLLFAEPFYSLDSGNSQASLAAAILAKYAPKTIAVDSPALSGLGAVMNIQATLSKMSASLTGKSILAAFRTGSNHPNFLAHPYTCDGKQVPAQTASCNSYMLIKTIKSGKIVTASNSWVTGAHLYTPPAKK
jgi:branched-chain amino acid transport system substrate-binding protein